MTGRKSSIAVGKARRGMEMENQYFNEALQNFVQDFAYGGAIRHLVDLGYDTDRIIKEYHYPLSRDTIDKIVKEHLKEKNKKNIS